MLINQLTEVPEDFICPITQQIMEQPVVAADGHSYEKAVILRWLETGHNISPLTGERLGHTTLQDNITLKKAIRSFKDRLPQMQREQQIQVDFYEAIKLREEMLAHILEKLEKVADQEEEESLHATKKMVVALKSKHPEVANSSESSFDQYVGVLLEVLKESDQKLLTKEDILTVLEKDNDDIKDIEQRGIYNLIRERLGEDAIDRLDEKLSIDGDGLYSTVKAIYRHRQVLDPNIMDFINKEESYFVGKFFDFTDPNGNQSTLSRIEACVFGNKNKFITFSLEGGSVFQVQHDGREVLNIETSFRRRAKLFGLVKNYFGDVKGNLDLNGIEFFRQRQEFVDDAFKIQPGTYRLTLTGNANSSSVNFNNFFKNEKDKLCQQHLNLHSVDGMCKYEFLITTNKRNAQEFAVVENSKVKELSAHDFRSIVCNVIDGEKTIAVDSANRNRLKEFIRIREIESEKSIEAQKRQEISDIEDNLLGFLKEDENKDYLHELLNNLVGNKLSLPKNVVVDKGIQKHLDGICQIFKELNIDSTKEMVLKVAAIEAIYSKLIDKNKKLFIFKIMNLLQEAFKHIESVKGRDLVMFWGGTGAGKSVSINYYLGHALESYQNYGGPI